MLSYISQFILWLFDWRVEKSDIKEKSFVIVAAPHTSNWDFIVGRLAISVLKIPQKVLMKKEFFFFPLKYFLSWLGALPIDRKGSTKMVDYIVEQFKKKDDFVFSISPEGTRSYVKKWRTGFYHIAIKAKVPIVLGKIDYKTKIITINKLIYPSGDFEKDFKEILFYYKDISGRFPEKYNPQPSNNTY